jgi:hypothetical protein
MMLRMSSRVCWHCETKAHMTRSGEPVVSFGDIHAALLMAPFVCDECNYMSIGMTTRSRDHPWQMKQGDFVDQANVTRWLPPTGVGRDFPDVPDHIAGAADEAYQCLSIDAYRGAVSLARAVVEATAKDKGITTGNLMTKIDEMHERGLIREHVRDAAHEVRHLGNDMAHGDFVQPATREEAEEVLGLMAEVLREVFQSPAQVERRKAARLAKEAGAAVPGSDGVGDAEAAGPTYGTASAPTT